jgi:hypothetical protein
MDDNNDKIEVDMTPDKDARDNLRVVVLDDDDQVGRQASGDDLEDTDPHKAIEKLKQSLKKEKEARQDAEHRAQQAAFEAKRASVEVEDTQMHLVGNAIETIRRDNEILTANYAEAMRNGDYETGARIQLTLNQNGTNLERLEAGHIKMQHDAKNKPVAPTPPQNLNPRQQIDQIIDQVSKPSAQWLRENKDRFDDERSINKMFRAHGDAVDDGIDPDTPEYFRYIEARLGFKQDDHGGSPMSSAAKPSSRQSPPPSAPVNRDGSGRSNVAHLTRAEADTAKAFGMTEKEYATHKMALQKEGRLTH